MGIIQIMANISDLRNSNLEGVFAAAITPVQADFSPDVEALPQLLDFFARRGCHGSLLFGTTGEGPSFSPAQRQFVFQAATTIRQEHPEFHLLAGTGTPSLDETIQLTRSAFDLGFDGVVVLPPYYYRNAGDDGLFAWYSGIIQSAVPGDGALLAYHIPAVSGVGLSIELLDRLKNAYPTQFAGLKDSSVSLEHAQALSSHFGTELRIFNGTDPLFATALTLGAVGCITALANISSPDLRRVWNAHQKAKNDLEVQARLEVNRTVMSQHPPAPPLVKAILHHRYHMPYWPVCPPLEAVSSEVIANVLAEMQFNDSIPTA